MTDIIRQHGRQFHLYADDSKSIWHLAIPTMESYVADIRVLMSLNCLKLNDDKSELLVFHFQFVLRPIITTLKWSQLNL